MSLSYVTLTLDLYDGTGNLISDGVATFTPTVQLTDTTDHELIPPAPVTVSFKPTGSPVVKLLATDNAAPLPAGWAWTVSFSGVPGNPAGFSFDLPYSGGSAQYLSSVTQVASPVTTFPLNPMTASGDMIYGGASPAGTPERLGIGSAGQVLTVAGGIPSWGLNGGATVTAALPTGATATDTPNLQAAITSLKNALAYGPATLQIPDGTYQVDSNALVIQSLSNFTVRAGRAVIKQAPNTAAKPNNTTGDLFVIADCTDFAVTGITFDGDRDNVSPMTPLTASAASGQPSVTVAAGNGSRYQAGQRLGLFGGLGSAEQSQSDGEAEGGGGTNLIVSSITAGGGSGGGDLITFTANLASSYTVISSTALSDGYGPYAYAGAYLSPYQTGNANSVAGRTLSGEDTQNGLHLLSCKRFRIEGVTSRNTWESAIKLGTGFAASNATDGCSDGTVTGCTVYHGYDQGISVWLSSHITVTGNVADAAGWAGVSLTSSDYCTVTGNECINSVYRVPFENRDGNGIAIEGGINNTVQGNVISGVYARGILLWGTCITFGLTTATCPTTATFLAAQTPAGTSIQLSSTAALQAGGLYSITDGSRTEAVSVATIVDSAHVTLNEVLQFAHSAGVYITQRIPQDNLIQGNIIYSTQVDSGISNQTAVRTKITGNTVRQWDATGGGNRRAIDLLSSTTAAITLPVHLGGNGSQITGNTIGSAEGSLASGPAIYADSTDTLLIEGNHVYGPSTGTNAGIQLAGVSDSTIFANVLHDNGDNTGSAQRGIYLNTGSVNALTCQRINITGNSILRMKNEGIYVLGGTSIIIAGNNVASCGGSAGIYLLGVQHSTIDGNVANSNSGGGIGLADNGTTFCLYNRIVNNTCRDDGSGVNVTTGAAQTQQNGIVESGNSNNNLFTANECDANAVGQLVTVGAGSVATRNIISGVITA